MISRKDPKPAKDPESLEDPEQSLQNYFDELFGGTLPEPEPKPPALSVAPVPPEPVKKEKPPAAAPRFADPAVARKEKLQKLLHSARVEIPVAVTEKVAIAEKVEVSAPVAFKADPDEIQEWEIAVAPTVTVAEPIADLKVEAPQGYQMPGLEWQANGRPQWAQARFDVLLVNVSGLTLAVPLIALGQIQPLSDELTHIFGQADWFIGIQPTQTGQIRVVNTAKFVMPERYDESFVENAKLLVSINDVPWGLAVDSVNQPIRLDPEEIKWRTDRSKRPWLAGTIKEHMCALLDIPMIGQMLMDSDKKLAAASVRPQR